MNEILRFLYSSFFSFPAYLDPGSGSILLQMIVAGLFGIGVFIGASWKKIKRLLSRKKEEESLDEDE